MVVGSADAICELPDAPSCFNKVRGDGGAWIHNPRRNIAALSFRTLLCRSTGSSGGSFYVRTPLSSFRYAVGFQVGMRRERSLDG